MSAGRMARRPCIVVFGGAVVDLVFSVEFLPEWSHTVQATQLRSHPGGKGLNQAIATSLLGSETWLVSAVGDDDAGARIVDTLESAGIETGHVARLPGAVTPAVAVFVNSAGEAAFVGWRNTGELRLGPSRVSHAREVIARADMVLVTLEPPIDDVREVIAAAKELGVKVLLNPAPAPERHEVADVAALLPNVDIVVPNYWEALALLNRLGAGHDPRHLAVELCRRGVPTVCVTNQERGCFIADGDELLSFEGVPSIAADTTGGSDAFCAALAYGLCVGKDLSGAVWYANAAGAAAVRKPGGSVAMPTAPEVDRVLRNTFRRPAP